jgi:hypothetical protein
VVALALLGASARRRVSSGLGDATQRVKLVLPGHDWMVGEDIRFAHGELPPWVESLDRTPADGRRQLIQHVTPFERCVEQQ